jgi:uncharacterized membrane protein YidH (DUF202 family)
MAAAAIADWDSKADMSYSSVSLRKFIILYQCLDALYHYLNRIQLLLGQTPRPTNCRITRKTAVCLVAVSLVVSLLLVVVEKVQMRASL